MARGFLAVVLILTVATSAFLVGRAKAQDENEARIIGFEDLHPGEESDFIKIPDGYEGFNWSYKFRCVTKENWPDSGYETGCIGKVCAYTSSYKDVSMQSIDGEPFDFYGAYITAAWRQKQDFTVEGWREGNLIYSETLLTDPNGPWWFEFEFKDIDMLYFRPGPRLGGTNHHLVIDDITVYP